MEANSNGTPWAKIDEMADEGYELWESGDLLAGYFKNAPSRLSIDNSAYRKHREAKKAAEKKGNLKDF
jgi:hypothetical protein